MMLLVLVCSFLVFFIGLISERYLAAEVKRLQDRVDQLVDMVENLEAETFSLRESNSKIGGLNSKDQFPWSSSCDSGFDRFNVNLDLRTREVLFRDFWEQNRKQKPR